MDSVNNVIDLAMERRRRGPRFDGGLMDILEVSRDLVCLCRGGAITAINGAGARMLGAATTDELTGRHLAEFLIPEYGPVLELFLAGKASEDKAVPTRIIALDKAIKDVEMQVFRAREIGSDATVVMCRDISHEGKLAGSAQSSETRFRLLVEHAMNLVCHVRDGIILYMNAAGARMLGTADPEQLVGTPLSALFQEDYAEILTPEVLETVVADKAALPMRVKRLDGSTIDALVMISGLPVQGVRELMVEARDITPHNRAVTALRHANETLEMRVIERTRELAEQRALAEERRHIAVAARRFSESLLQAIPSPVWFKDARGQVQTCNRAFRALFSGDALPSPDLVAALMPAEDAETDQELLAGTRDQAAFEGRLGNGTDALVLKIAFPDEEGRPVGIIGVLTDITERKAMEGELQRLATRDPLTGAANRRHFLERAVTELERSSRYGHSIAVLMLDIDYFKRINDSHGHAIGDEALKETVAVIQDSLRDLDVLGRLGGEEFAVLLPETGEAGALEVAERLRRRIAAIAIPLPEGTLSFTVSQGVALRISADGDVAEMLARADEALYRAKNGGRNRVELG